MNYHFVFDYNKCVGCQACSVACMIENGKQEPEPWRTVFTNNKNHFPGIALFHLSLACNHCDHAPCMRNCPTNAYSRDMTTGAVIHHSDKCIGCRYCSWACPYDAPKYNPNKGIIEKCTFCNHRISENKKPMCTNSCPTGALSFGTTGFLKEQNTPLNPISIEVGANLKTKALRHEKGPEQDASLFHELPKQFPRSIINKINARDEWPLVLFTLLISFLVGAQWSQSIPDSLTYQLIFLGLLGSAGIFSLFHLGKKLRAWRALSNLRFSWLSREIALFTIFFILFLLNLVGFTVPQFVWYVLGVLLLFSIDRIYDIAKWQWKLPIHSAQTLFIAISVWAVWQSNIYLLFGILLFRLFIYLYRKMNRSFFFNPIVWVRILALAGTIAGYTLKMPDSIVIGIFVLGECIDRIDFYNDLSIDCPQNDLKG